MNNESIQEAINQNARYIIETDLSVSRPENVFNAVDIGTDWQGMSLYIFKSQEAFEKFMSDDHKLHQEVTNCIIPFLVEDNPHEAFATAS